MNINPFLDSNDLKSGMQLFSGINLVSETEIKSRIHKEMIFVRFTLCDCLQMLSGVSIVVDFCAVTENSVVFSEWKSEFSRESTMSHHNFFACYFEFPLILCAIMFSNVILTILQLPLLLSYFLWILS